MVGCTQEQEGGIVFTGASQNSARFNRTAIHSHRERRRNFAGNEYADYDEFIQKRLSEGDDAFLQDLPDRFIQTRLKLSNQIWCVWRGDPELAAEDPENWEPMCKSYEPLRIDVYVNSCEVKFLWRQNPVPGPPIRPPIDFRRLPALNCAETMAAAKVIKTGTPLSIEDHV